MHRYESIDLGTYRGDEYFLVTFVDPVPPDGVTYDPDENAEHYGVAVVRAGIGPLEENVQIVRMDTTHGRPHVDLLYLPPDATVDRKLWLDDGYAYRRMKRYLLANWRDFADRYRRHERGDGPDK